MLVLAKHRNEYTKQLESLNQEFSELFRDYAGFENPPVLESHPVLEKIKKSLWIPATENQYLLGSLDLEEDGYSRIRDWCNQLEMLERNVIRTNEVIHDFFQERHQRHEGVEMDQLELVLEQQKVLIQESLKLQQENQKQIKQDQRLLMQQKKTISTQQNDIKKKEIELESKRQKLAEDQALLMAREQSQFLLDHHQQLISQQKDLLESVQHTGERLDQDKNWIKSLLKGLLDQQEKFQHLEDRMREREKDSMIRKEADLQHERGWIKVEKAKLRKSEIQESKRERPVSETIF